MTRITVELIIAALIFAAGMFTMRMIIPKCPPCECPRVIIPPCPKPEVQSIDFDKVKNLKGTLVLNQHYQVEANGDSLVVKAFIDALDKRLKDLKISKCK